MNHHHARQASRWAEFVLVFLLGIFALLPASHAQIDDDDIETSFRKPSAQEAQQLREVLAVPLPQRTWGQPNYEENLRALFRRKEMAARTLGDPAQIEAVIRDAVRLLPDADLKNKLGKIMIVSGRIDEGLAMTRRAIAEANPFVGAGIVARLACTLYNLNRDDAARAAIVEAQRRISAAQADAKTDSHRNHLLRAGGMAGLCLSQLDERRGQYAKALEAAEAADVLGRKALALVSGQLHPAQQLWTRRDAALFLQRRFNAYLAARRLHDAENALAEYIRLAAEVQLPPEFLANLQSRAGSLRFDQHEFARAEQLERKADAIRAGFGRAPTDALRLNHAQAIIWALIGQKKWSQALVELQRVDQAMAADPEFRQPSLLTHARAITYFVNGRYAEAAALFGQVAQTNGNQLGSSHFLTAQSTGLQGAALWRSGTAENRGRALPLLKNAVRDTMAPANADHLENIGLRKELREIIFAAYLEAVSSPPGEDAVQALGAADWVRGGVVQEALGDAAARAAASTPALADVVRREQDAKNEVAGLRRYLSGAAGGAASPLPGIAAQMRERIAVLEAERAKLQAEIKAKFPDYERLVRPTPPSVADIARQLEPQQALVMLLPTTDAVYAWAVASDRPAGFVRIALPEAQLNEMVGALRRQLDFANGASVGKTYDSANAFALYDKLLAPLASVWQGKTQLVVAAGGALSQLPFSVLHTRPGGGFDANAPWLIKQASITQVPSLSAWLAIKSIAKGKSAEQAFAGWGDPTFGPQASVAATRTVLTRSVVLTRASTFTDLEQPDKTTSAPSALKYAEISPLPETREELLAIANTLQADPARDVLLGEKATRESVLAASKSGQLASKRVIAFATHGLMAGDLPNLTQPALAMAATGTEDKNPFAPLLTLEDVLTLKLNADWVVLSACNTAAADGKAEEALSGLARGFFYAGSRSLLVTHWAVESESAKELTTSTFAHYTANPQAPKAESLRQAMLKVMGMPQFSHPAYWAPYALVGDGGR